MMTRIHGNIVFECDSCNESLDTETSEWGDAMVALRSNNWRARKVADVWTHECEVCNV